MEAPPTTNKSFNQPRTMAELLPGLSGILSKDSMLTLTAKKQKQSRMTTANPSTAEQIVKPLTIAEMRADILALKVQSPRRFAQSATTSKKRNWNSSVKVENKTISHTGGGQMKHNSVRKVLNFQVKPKVNPGHQVAKSVSNTRMTMMSETPKFPRPEYRPKKSAQTQAITNLKRNNNIRISGVCDIPETPVLTAKPAKSRFTIANKENFPKPNQVLNKNALPKLNHKRLIPVIPDTPMLNESWKSSCDASFIQKEKEIEDIENKVKAITEEQTLENIAEVSPPVSTPFKEYRNVNEYFNNSSSMENSAVYHDNTIMCFDNQTINTEAVKREESVIVSLCDLLNKASVTQPEKTSTALEDLLKVERRTENNIRMIDQGIATLKNIRESELKSLRYVRKMIDENKIGRSKSESNKDKTLVTDSKADKITVEQNVMVGESCSIMKSCSKSPSYKIPKKNMCLRKKVFHKSMPDVLGKMQTPPKETNKALSIYMKMKEQMNFLNTPVVKQNVQRKTVPDTPAVTSQNLQTQLDRLYNGS